jgi:hypothetical protein
VASFVPLLHFTKNIGSPKTANVEIPNHSCSILIKSEGVLCRNHSVERTLAVLSKESTAGDVVAVVAGGKEAAILAHLPCGPATVVSNTGLRMSRNLRAYSGRIVVWGYQAYADTFRDTVNPAAVTSITTVGVTSRLTLGGTAIAATIGHGNPP